MNARMNMPEATLTSTGGLTGYWGKENYNATHFAAKIKEDEDGNMTGWEANATCSIRRLYAESLTLNNKPHYRYYLTLKLNTGLASCAEPIPKDIPLSIKLTRAAASKALLACVTKPDVDAAGNTYIQILEEYSKNCIELIDPSLHVSYVVSEYYDKRLSPTRIPNFKYKFNEAQIQT